MKIVIFGGVGFIGTNIARAAMRRGHHIVAFDSLMRKGVDDNLTYLRQSKQFHFIKGDIRKKQDFMQLPKGIDCIINLAANPAVPKSISNPLFDFRINVIGHLNVLEYAKIHGKLPVIFASSNKVYTDKLNQMPLKETEKRYVPIDRHMTKGVPESADVDGWDGYTNSPYGAGKLAAEKYTREYGNIYAIPYVINRMSCIYGEFQKGVESQGWVDWFIRAKRNNLPIRIYGNGKQVRDVLFATDVADLFIYQAEHMKACNGKTYNVGGGSRAGYHTSVLELIDLIDALFPGKPLRYTWFPWRKSDQRYYVSDIRRVMADTGWHPSVELAKGLSIMWDAYHRREKSHNKKT